MNKKDHIENRRPVGGDYFFLYYSKTYNKNLQFYLDQFNLNDYWIYKMTSQQRLVDIDDVINFKYSGFIFFKKTKYNKDIINKWLDYYYSYIDEVKFLSKNLPPFDPEKIIIKK